jgi:hypothetical protein
VRLREQNPARVKTLAIMAAMMHTLGAARCAVIPVNQAVFHFYFNEPSS